MAGWLRAAALAKRENRFDSAACEMLGWGGFFIAKKPPWQGRAVRACDASL